METDRAAAVRSIVVYGVRRECFIPRKSLVPALKLIGSITSWSWYPSTERTPHH